MPTAHIYKLLNETIQDKIYQDLELSSEISERAPHSFAMFLYDTTIM